MTESAAAGPILTDDPAPSSTKPPSKIETTSVDDQLPPAMEPASDGTPGSGDCYDRDQKDDGAQTRKDVADIPAPTKLEAGDDFPDDHAGVTTSPMMGEVVVPTDQFPDNFGFAVSGDAPAGSPPAGPASHPCRNSPRPHPPCPNSSPSRRKIANFPGGPFPIAYFLQQTLHLRCPHLSPASSTAPSLGRLPLPPHRCPFPRHWPSPQGRTFRIPPHGRRCAAPTCACRRICRLRKFRGGADSRRHSAQLGKRRRPGGGGGGNASRLRRRESG